MSPVPVSTDRRKRSGHRSRPTTDSKSAEIVARWVARKQERGCLPRTLAQYRWAQRRAFATLRRGGRTTDPRKWRAEDIRWLTDHLRRDPWTMAIVADLARFARNFVFQEVGLPRRPPPTRVRWLTEDQVRALIAMTAHDRLLRLVALLGVGQGLRRVEWLRLRVDDLDLAGQRILVRGKGRGEPKAVWMAMHPALPGAVHDYLAWRNERVRRSLRHSPLASVPPELFIHPQAGRWVAYGEGGANGWMKILERRMRREGVEVKLSTHMLRRSAATFLERALLRSPDGGRDGVYRSVQEFLRHDILATTMRYLERDPARQRRALDVFAAEFDWRTDAGAPFPSPSGEAPPERRGLAELGRVLDPVAPRRRGRREATGSTANAVDTRSHQREPE